MGITSRGTIRVKQVQVPARGAPVRVTRISIPREPGVTCKRSIVRETEGIRLTIDPAKLTAAFEVWVVLSDCEAGRSGVTVLAPKAVGVESARPVTLGERT